MKIDKRKPQHWLYLGIFSLNILLALCLRTLLRPKRDNSCILYGHQLNSNLKPIFDYNQRQADLPTYYLSMNPSYYKLLKKNNSNILCGLNPIHCYKLASCTHIISDHGLHSLLLLLKFSDIQFHDVWHGIPFKGFDADDFRHQQHYQQVWVTSKKLKQLYIERFGFAENIVQPIGYARTDILINGADIQAIKQSLNIKDSAKKIILLAPTWQQDEKNRNILPFSCEEKSFYQLLNIIGEAHNALFLFRAHLNSGSIQHSNYSHIQFIPQNTYPQTEEILLISDMLICDWSSIAFDYLLLDRPTLFLDVPAPFKKGFSLDASYRYGKIVNDVTELESAITHYIQQPEDYNREFSKRQRQIKEELYDDLADGQVSKRIYQQLTKNL